MTQEDKELLIKDLCARLPYGVKLKIRQWKTPVELTIIKYNVLSCNYIINDNYKLDDIKPYLRSMLNMPKEEEQEYSLLLNDGGWGITKDLISDCIDWLNAHHFDYRGLIEKGLAIAVTEDNNPYKD